MTNNTIPNVPRELLERAAYTLELAYEVDTPTVRDLRAILSAPSPAGVDGLSASAMPDEVFADEFAAWWEEDGKYVRAGGGQYEKSFAFQAWRYLMPRVASNQAVIDGLRGEVATLTVESELGLGHYVNMQKERDQQAQRIGELAGHLEFAVTMLTVAGLAGNAQVEAMRSALSAGVGGVK